MSSIGRIVRKNHSAVFWCTRHYPKVKREAVYTLYAFFKHLDDLSSSTIAPKEKADILDAWHREIENIYETKVPATAIGRRIYKNCMRFKLQKHYFEQILQSYALDCPTPLCTPALSTFETYCLGVSEIPCYLILKIIAEFDDQTTQNLSRAIGRAVEITNILKNVKEDTLRGHVYFPKEFLQNASIDPTLTPKEILTHTNLNAVREQLAGIARTSYAEAYRLLKENHNKNSKPVVYMLNLYHAYFELMDTRGWEIISPKPELKLKDHIKLIFRALFKSSCPA